MMWDLVVVAFLAWALLALILGASAAGKVMGAIGRAGAELAIGGARLVLALVRALVALVWQGWRAWTGLLSGRRDTTPRRR